MKLQVDLVPLWKALADTKRRRIIQLLGEKPRTTSEICVNFDVSRFAIMRHLKVLEQSGLIKTRREGRQRWNFLNEDLFQHIQQTYLDKDTSDEFQLKDILSFLSRQEDLRKETAVSEQPIIQQTVLLQAPPDKVYQALTDEIDAWWSYRVMVDSKVYLEPHVSGRFYEAFNNGGGALYAFVTYLKPAEEIRLNGSMGLADGAVSNLVHITLEPYHQNNTQLHLTHRFLSNVNVVTVDTFKHSWEELLTQHLKSFVEQDTRYQAPLQ